MSENIQSIANGTFVLGNTSATTYQAGPGIQITQPSEGTVRISNDETVLYENDNPSMITNTSASLNLSENPLNFERLRFKYKISYGNGELTQEICPSIGTNYPIGGIVGANSDGTSIFNDTCNASFTISSVELNYGCRMEINRTSKGISIRTDRGPSILKVIGINRISGSNA